MAQRMTCLMHFSIQREVDILETMLHVTESFLDGQKYAFSFSVQKVPFQLQVKMDSEHVHMEMSQQNALYNYHILIKMFKK
jgi:hypothetical protein